MQGVALIIAVKKRHAKGFEKPLAEVFHGDLWGSRKEKYAALNDGKVGGLSAAKLPNKANQYPLVQRDFELEVKYSEGFDLQELFEAGTLGFQTHRDGFAISMDKSDLEERLKVMRDSAVSDIEIAHRYGIKDNRDWKISEAREKAINEKNDVTTLCAYRPFDNRHCILSDIAMDYPRPEFNSHILGRSNLTLTVPRQISFVGYRHVLVTDLVAESCFISNKTKEGNVNFPLYQYEDIDQSTRVNMDPAIRKRIEEAAMGSTPKGDMPIALNNNGEPDIMPRYTADGRPNEVAIFDYIYGVLHCPQYRETYKEFLKIDFPRIPYPPSPEVFRDVQEKGSQLRRLHLMEADAIGETPYSFDGEGDSIVDKPKLENGCVFINDTQYFENVPQIAWEFYIGGYQPAQKWLKDRKWRELSFDDIRHYQKIIKILSETDRIMKTIEMPLD